MQTVETLNEGLKRAYTLTITAAEIEARVDREVATIAPQVRMPGFRPGKVPANLVRKQHGEQLRREALNNSIQDGVQKLLADNQLRPAMQPSVELNEDFAFGQDAQVKVALEVLPQVPAPAIDALTLERLVIPVDDAAVEEATGDFAKQQNALAAHGDDYAAQTGDVVVLDFAGKVDGVAFDGGTGEGMKVELGSGNLIPGFEDQLVGIKTGEERVLNVTFPEDYPAENLKGKAATFDVKATQILDPSQPKLDDDFAKTLGLESIDKLRELFRGQIEQQNNGLTRTHMKRKLLDQLAASHDFEVPPSMVEAEFEQIWNQLTHEAGHEEDPAAALAEMEKDKDDYRNIAVRRVRLGLLLSEIGQANGVVITDMEMNRLIMQAAQQYAPKDRERFVEYVRNEPMAAAQLRAPLYEDKVVDFLFEKATITEREVTKAELEAALEEDADGEGKGHVHGPGCGHDHDEEKPKAKKAPAKKAAAASEGEIEPEAAPKPAKKPAAKKAAVAEGDAPADADAPKPAKKAPAKKAAKAE